MQTTGASKISTYAKARMLMLVVLMFSIAFMQSCAKKEKFPITVFTVNGTAHRISNGVKTGLAAGDVIGEGDSIETGDKASVELLINVGSMVKIHSKTHFKVSKRKINDKGDLASAEFDLTSGRALFVMNKLLKGALVLVKTPTVVCSVRGTSFTVQSATTGNNNISNVEVIGGVVNVAYQDNDKPHSADIKGSECMTVTSGIATGEGASRENVTAIKRPLEGQTLEALIKEVKQLYQRAIIVIEPMYKDVPESIEEVKKDIVKEITITEKIDTDGQKTVVLVLKTEKQIRDHYNKLEQVYLEDGSVIVGAIISQAKTNARIHTTNGIISVPTDSINRVIMR